MTNSSAGKFRDFNALQAIFGARACIFTRLEKAKSRGQSVFHMFLPQISRRCLQLPEHALHLQLGRREVITIAEVFTLLAVVPCLKIDIHLALSMACPLAIDANLKDSSDQWFPELKMV
jgi:hypothetical protein